MSIKLVLWIFSESHGVFLEENTWMSQEFSKWLGSMGYTLLKNGIVYIRVITH